MTRSVHNTVHNQSTREHTLRHIYPACVLTLGVPPMCRPVSAVRGML
jgi:hypothetical protein